MQSGGHFSDGTRYGTDEIVNFVGGKHGIFGEAFFDSAIAQSLKLMVPGKRVLDIGCGVGDWCCLAAHCGAITVNGFDIQEEMVKLARQMTIHLDTVHIQLGDVAQMPYDNASFDVAISLFVTCNLSPNAFAKHFQELYRVLVPGGKAILLIPTDWSHSGLYTKFEADPMKVEHKIIETLAKIPKHPTTDQITKAFKEDTDILMSSFAVGAEGDIFLIKNVNQLKYGQPIWRRTEVMIFPNFFYSNHSNIEHILAAGLCIDSVENYFTEERRIVHNDKKPKLILSKKCVENPLALVYHVSKPAVDQATS